MVTGLRKRQGAANRFAEVNNPHPQDGGAAGSASCHKTRHSLADPERHPAAHWLASRHSGRSSGLVALSRTERTAEGRGRLRQWPSADACGRVVRCDLGGVARVACWFGAARTRTGRTKATSSRPRPASAGPQIRTPEKYGSEVRKWRDRVPHNARPVLNHPLAEPLRGFCKQGSSSPLGSTTGQRPFRAFGRILRASEPRRRPSARVSSAEKL